MKCMCVITGEISAWTGEVKAGMGASAEGSGRGGEAVPWGGEFSRFTELVVSVSQWLALLEYLLPFKM